jgi:alkaline phosphatase
MKYFSCCALLAGLFLSLSLTAQTSSSYSRGHSHNDYHQHVPLLTAYHAGMGSVEADVFLRDNELFVAHDTSEIRAGATLKKLYLEPLARLYTKNGKQPYKDRTQSLQLVIDIKQDHKRSAGTIA